MSFLATRLAPVKPSASVVVSQLAKSLKAQGEDIVDLGLGEPDFDTPAHIINAAHQAALNGQTRYTPMAGTAALKEAIQKKLKRDNDLSYEMDEIIASNGAKQIIFQAMMATLDPGDEVILCAPYFGVYKDIVLILGGKPILAKCPEEDGFKLTPERLQDFISQSTKWVILNLPSNPAGVTYTKLELISLGKVIEEHPNILVMSDEIYEHILFDNQTFLSFAKACPSLNERVLTVNGVSKAYAMTGWRIGYGAGPKTLIAGMTKVQSQVSSAPCAIAQAAAAAALNGPQNDVETFRQAFEQRRDLVVNRISKINGLTLVPPGGAFYAFIGCAEYIGSEMPDGKVIKTDVDFTNYLLNVGKVAAVPGSAYGISPFFRISTASSENVLSKGMDNIAACLDKLKPLKKRM